jgi:hypothetical protein
MFVSWSLANRMRQTGCPELVGHGAFVGGAGCRDHCEEALAVAIGYSCPILQQLMSKLLSRRTPEQRIHGLAQKVKNRDRGFGHQLLTTEFFGHKLLTCSPHHSRVINCTTWPVGPRLRPGVSAWHRALATHQGLEETQVVSSQPELRV